MLGPERILFGTDSSSFPRGWRKDNYESQKAALNELKHAGIVASQRGADGGYSLARPPEEVTLADVLRVMEGPLASVRDQRPESISYTGPAETLNVLDHDAFKLGSVGGPEIDHSTRFVVVDKKGQIRGYYGIAEGNPVEKITKDVARLEQEPS